jgi:hypothetical protein
MDLSSSATDLEYFKLYSEFPHDPIEFKWNPLMDLIVTISCFGLSVWRLISGDESPLVFFEQLPFRPSAVDWSPTGREVAVGDEKGNIFVYSADREDSRRLWDLELLHKDEIVSLQWQNFTIRRKPDLEMIFSNDSDADQPVSLLSSLCKAGVIFFSLNGNVPLRFSTVSVQASSLGLHMLSPSKSFLAVKSSQKEKVAVTFWRTNFLNTEKNELTEAMSYRLELSSLFMRFETQIQEIVRIMSLTAGPLKFKSALDEGFLRLSVSLTSALNKLEFLTSQYQFCQSQSSLALMKESIRNLKDVLKKCTKNKDSEGIVDYTSALMVTFGNTRRTLVEDFNNNSVFSMDLEHFKNVTIGVAEAFVFDWAEETNFQVLFTDKDRFNLYIGSISVQSDSFSKTVIDAERYGSRWHLVSLYSTEELCALVSHAGIISICLVRYTESTKYYQDLNLFEDSITASLDIEMTDSVKAQQVGVEYVDKLTVSEHRKLATIYGDGRLITLDLAPEEL